MGAGQREILLFSVDDAATGKIIGGECDSDFVARDDTDVVLAHFARKVGENYMSAILKLYAEHGVGEGFANDSFHFYGFFFCHGYSLN